MFRETGQSLSRDSQHVTCDLVNDMFLSRWSPVL